MTGMDTARASCERQLPVDAGEHAVAVDIGVDDRGDAGALEAAGHLDGVELGGFGPAFDRDLAAARIDADGDLAGKRVPPLSPSSGRAAAMVPRMTRLRPLPSQLSIWVERADAAAELHRHLHRS